MKDLEKVTGFLKSAGTFYLTTVEKDRPKCRPVSLYMEIEGKIYFAVGTYKDVYRQLAENGNAEICACAGNNFLRYYGKAVFHTEPKYEEKALETMPVLRQIYNEETGNKLGVFHLSDATAEFRSMMGITETIKL